MTAINEHLEGFLAQCAGEPRDSSRSPAWLCGYDGAIYGKKQNEEREAREAAERAAYAASPEYIAAHRAANAKARARKRFSNTPRTLDRTGWSF